MALFTDDRAEPPLFGRPIESRGSRRRSRAGWWVLSVAIVGALGLSLLPTPYVIERPGPVFDTLGEVEVDGDLVPLITIPGEKTFPTDGSLDMLTVNVVGDRQSQPNWFEVITSWADPSRAVVPLEAVYPDGETREEANERSAIDMQNSQKDAIAASLSELGYSFDSTLTVAAFSIDSPSDGVLEEGDQIVTVNGEEPTDVTQLRSLIAENGIETPVSMGIVRDGESSTVEVTPVDNAGGDGKPIVGISVGADYDFPFEVKIQLENVGGPSAGMMFSLGIIDKLTPGALTGGEDVAGTGTITADGIVGPIGGIRQKLYGARDAGADYFLAPAENCDEVVGHVPSGLSVFAVTRLDDALGVLEAVSGGGDTSGLPTCEAA